MDEQQQSRPEGQAPIGEQPEAPGGGDEGQQQGQSEGAQWSETTQEEPSAFDSGKAWVSDLFAQASEVILRPGEFFASLPREGGLWRATVFAIVMGAVAGVIGFILRVLPGLGWVIKMPFAAFAFVVVGAFLIHVLAMVAGGKGPLEGSYRLAAYLMVFLPLAVAAGVLPYLKIAMAGYGLYALIMGVIPVHELEERHAWSVFGAAGAAGLLAMSVGTLAGWG
jgi:hypothetical protein